MPAARHLFNALRAFAVWLLMVSVLLGPIGIGGSSPAASPPCGAACPCDEEPTHDEHGDEHEGDDELEHEAEHDPCDDEPADAHDDGAPANDECPDGCSSCGAAPSVALAMVGFSLVASSPPTDPDLLTTRSDGPAVGVRTGVFRPPRSSI